MLVMPESRPDETTYSLLSNIARLNSTDIRYVIGQLTGCAQPKSIIDCSINIPHFCKMTRNTYGSPRDFVSNFSILHMRAHLGEIDHGLLMQLESGIISPSLNVMDFGTKDRCVWKVCPECVEEDLYEHGTSYWHRSHLLSTSQFCTLHGSKLNVVIIFRKDLHDKIVLPHHLWHLKKISCESDISDTNTNLYGFSTLGTEALSDKSSAFSSVVVKRTIMDALNEFGSLSSNGKIIHRSLLEDLRDAVGGVVQLSNLLSVELHLKVTHLAQ